MSKYLEEIGISEGYCTFNTSVRDTDCDGNDTERQKKFDLERKIYGFDERETWCLDDTITQWLYCHLKMYLNIAGKVVDLSWKKYQIPVLIELPKEKLTYRTGCDYPEHFFAEDYKEMTQEEATKLCISYLEAYLLMDKGNTVEEELLAMEKGQQAFKIFGIILPDTNW